MANGQAIATGFLLIIVAGAGYLYPVTDTKLTIPQVNDVCATGLGQMGQMFSGDVIKICREFGYLMYGIYGSGIGGLILIIVGAIISGKKKEDEPKQADTSWEILKDRYAKGEISKEEFENMKKDLGN